MTSRETYDEALARWKAASLGTVENEIRDGIDSSGPYRMLSMVAEVPHETAIAAVGVWLAEAVRSDGHLSAFTHYNRGQHTQLSIMISAPLTDEERKEWDAKQAHGDHAIEGQATS